MTREEIDEEIEFYEDKIEDLKDAKKHVEALISLDENLELGFDFEEISDDITRNIQACMDEIDNLMDSYEDIGDLTNEYLEQEYWKSQF